MVVQNIDIISIFGSNEYIGIRLLKENFVVMENNLRCDK